MFATSSGRRHSIIITHTTTLLLAATRRRFSSLILLQQNNNNNQVGRLLQRTTTNSLYLVNNNDYDPRRLILRDQRQAARRRGRPSLSTTMTTTTNATRKEGEARMKPWQDRRRSLDDRVHSLINSRRVLHQADLLSKDMTDLIVECCRYRQSADRVRRSSSGSSRTMAQQSSNSGGGGDSSSLHGMHLAHEVVDYLASAKRSLYKQRQVAVHMPITIWQNLIYGWAVRADRSHVARSRMKETVQQAIDVCRSDERIMLTVAMPPVSPASSSSSSPLSSRPIVLESQPTTDLFNTYLLGLSNAARRTFSAAMEAEATLGRMLALSQRNQWHCKPNTKSYTTVISAYKNARHRDAGRRALAVLQWMRQVQNMEQAAYYQQHGEEYDYLNVSRHRRKIVTADAAAYTATIQAMIQSAGVDKAANRLKVLVRIKVLLAEILQCHDGSVIMDAQLGGVIMHAFAQTAAHARFGRQRIAVAKQAEQILLSMMQTLILNAEDGTNHKFVVAYNACLDAYAKSYTPESATRCESLLSRMVEDDNLVKPNASSFNTCLSAWANSSKFHASAAPRAEALLDLQEKLVASGTLDGKAKPDFQSYSIAITAYARSDLPDKVQHARRLLDRLLNKVSCGEMKVTRNAAAPFTAVLSAVARSPFCPTGGEGKTDTGDDSGFTSTVEVGNDNYSVAVKTYHGVIEDTFKLGVSPDHHFFAAFLRCIGRHCPQVSLASERDAMTQQVFAEACEVGEVSRLVVDGLIAIFAGDSAATWRWMLAQASDSVLEGERQRRKLPVFWSRNVPAQFIHKKMARR